MTKKISRNEINDDFNDFLIDLKNNKADKNYIDEKIENIQNTNINNYSILFNITDGINTISDVIITVSGQSVFTNSQGIATISNITNNSIISYTISKSGFVTQSGFITINNQNVIQNIILVHIIDTYSITFNITDGNNPISGAIINILSQSLTTNINGVATIDNVATSSNIEFTISKSGYSVYTGTINLDNQNISENISLIALPTYTATFTISDGLNPISNATLIINSKNTTSDNNGIAIINGLTSANNIIYTISKTGYNTLTGSIDITNQNVSQNIILSITNSLNIMTNTPKIILSLINLNPSYTGPCINVRRDSDNTMIDIGYYNGYLDINSLISFVGTSNGYVTKWYDSSGNGNDFIQTNISNQPRIVNNGIVEEAIWFAGSTTTNLQLLPNSTINNLNTFGIIINHKPITKNAGAIYNLIDKGPGFKINYYDTIDAVYFYSGYSSTPIDTYVSPGKNMAVWNSIAVSLDKSVKWPNIYVNTDTSNVIGSTGSGTPLDDSSSSIVIGSNFQGYLKCIILCGNTLSNTDISSEMTLINSINNPILHSNVTFTITDIDNIPLSEASITFNGITYISDINGQVTFNNVVWGANKSYTISKSLYYQSTGTININANTINKIVSLTLIPSYFNVTFNVTDGVTNISGAVVTFDNRTINTDSNGNAVFTSVHVGSDLSYSISLTNYRTATGYIDIVDNDIIQSAFISTLTTISTNQYFVDPINGNDSNNGLSVDTAFKSLNRAQTEGRRKSASNMTEDCYIYLRKGTYLLPNGWNFNNIDGGSNNYKLIYKSYDSEMASITNSITWTGWSQIDISKNIWSTDTPSNLTNYTETTPNCNDKLMTKASYPATGYNIVATTIMSNNMTQFGFNEGDIPTIADMTDLQILIWGGGGYNWSADVLKVINIDYTNHIITVESGAANQLLAGSRYKLLRAKEFLTAPGQYYYSSSEKKMYIIPWDSFDENKIKIPMSHDSVSLYNSNNDNYSMKYMQFEQLIFEGWQNGLFVLHSDNVNFIDNIIRNIAGTGLYHQENKNSNIIGNHIYNIGKDAVVINGYAFKSWHTSSSNIIENNEIHDIGLLSGGAVAVTLDSGDDAIVSHNRIYNSPRWGISFGGQKNAQLISQTIDNILVTEDNINQFRHGVNNLIEYNDVSNCNTDSDDTSPIYTYGCGPNNIIRYNAVHDSGVPLNSGYGIYFDDGADGSLVDSNVIYNMQLTQELGDYRAIIIKGEGNTVKNNILADSNCIGALVPSNSTDPAGDMTFDKNIVYKCGDIIYDMYGPCSVVSESNYNTFYNPEGDYNVYRNEAKNIEDLRLGTYVGNFDQNSILEDPKFINAYNNDYRLRYDSPCRALGNEDIDFGSIGLTSSYKYSNIADSLDQIYVTTTKAGFNPNISINIGEQITLALYGRSVNKYYITFDETYNISVTSSNSSIAAVNGTTITGTSKGVVAITISVSKNSNTKSTKIYILVADSFDSVSLSIPYSRFRASLNDTGKLKIIPILRTYLGRIMNQSEATTINYSSSDISKLIIDNSGLCTILDTGLVTITATVVVNGIQKTGTIVIQALADDLYDHVNMLQNGDMASLDNWTLISTGGVTGNNVIDTLTYDSGNSSMKITVSGAMNSSQNYVDLKQSGLNFINNTPYRLMISHKSSPDLQYWVYAPVGLSTAPLTTSIWQKWYTDFISTVSNSNITLELLFGKNSGVFWIDNLKLYRLNIYRCPKIPTNIQVSDNTTSLSISWDVGSVDSSVSTYVVGYNIYINGIKNNTSIITSTNYTANISSTANYDIQITTVDNEGNESFKSSSIIIRR